MYAQTLASAARHLTRRQRFQDIFNAALNGIG
ncbi:MAG: hypothetical protein ACI8TQ_003848, partial [Planctomycetota bacterium]